MNLITPIKPLFPLGRIVQTQGVLALGLSAQTYDSLFARHVLGYWREMSADDQTANEKSVLDGDRIISRYTIPGTTTRVWIVTEADRSLTTLLLPHEY